MPKKPKKLEKFKSQYKRGSARLKMERKTNKEWKETQKRRAERRVLMKGIPRTKTIEGKTWKLSNFGTRREMESTAKKLKSYGWNYRIIKVKNEKGREFSAIYYIDPSGRA